MAIQAHPVPVYPYAPVPPNESVPVQPYPSVPVRLPIFAVPLIVHDVVQRVVAQIGPRASGGGWSWKGLKESIGENYGRVGASSLESVEEGTSMGEGDGFGKRHETGGTVYFGSSFDANANSTPRSRAAWRNASAGGADEMGIGIGIGASPASYALNTRVRTKKLD
jgi:hypothetical protein